MDERAAAALIGEPHDLDAEPGEEPNGSRIDLWRQYFRRAAAEQRNTGTTRLARPVGARFR